MGGLIEIHGGKEGMTHGCISLENSHMDEVYRLVPLEPLSPLLDLLLDR